MVVVARVKLIHLLLVFLLALGAMLVLFWPSRSLEVSYWLDKFFSPGTVSIAHQNDADGNKIVCRDCHQPVRAVSNRICQRCHDRKYFEQHNPLLADSHQVFAQKDYCLRCHLEHKGDYMGLSFSGFTAEVHHQLPVKTDNCALCHRLAGSQAHPDVTNKDCRGCHSNFEWTSQFTHRQYLTKAATGEKMLQLCQKCHVQGYHYTRYPSAANSCVFCHELWGKRKNKPVPYPAGIFGKTAVYTK